ncbi:polysaccharide biosynthesis C-terminal domain-containing protein [Vibrio coralliilyticus]|uniref:polysaccharide biosynthesis C-terminal domain-containing protein n=1 Tax=Vibrio coralliilyticus TaxID=190893 RepID=UPI0039170CE4
MIYKKDGLLITVLTVVLPMLVQLIYIRYASYHIDKTLFGSFVLVNTFIMGLSFVFMQIPLQSFNRFFNSSVNKEDFINEFRTLLIVINTLSGFVIFAIGSISDDYSSSFVILVVVYFILLSYASIYQQYFLLMLNRRKYFQLKISESLAKHLFPIIFYHYFGTLFSMFLGLFVGYFISIIIMLYSMRKIPFRIIVDVDNLKSYYRFALPMLFVSLFSFGIAFSDRFFIDYYLTKYEVGIYSVLSTVAGLGSVIGQIYSTYATPKILKEFEIDPRLTLNYLNRSLIALSSIFVLGFIVITIMPNFFYHLFISPEILDQKSSLPVFYLLTASVFITVIQTAMSMYLNLFKKLVYLLYFYAVGFVVNILGNFFIKDYGLLAAALSTLVSYLFILVFQLYYSVKKFRSIYYGEAI